MPSWTTVEYTYNAWGRQCGRSTTENSGVKLYQYNALKYRGYYYDVDLGFYYLESRYYDPVIGRFINADAADVLSVDQGSCQRKRRIYSYQS